MSELDSKIRALDRRLRRQKEAGNEEEEEFANDAFELTVEFLRHASLNLKILQELCRADRSIFPDFYEKIAPLMGDLKKFRERIENERDGKAKVQFPEAICHSRTGAKARRSTGSKLPIR